jgi:hypothetical protein
MKVKLVMSVAATALLAACSGEPAATNSPLADSAVVSFVGIWNSQSRYMDVGIPITLRNTRWAALSAGVPEEVKAETFEEQAAWYNKLLAADADVFAAQAQRAYRPVLTAAGQVAADELAAKAKTSQRGPFDQCMPRNVIGFGQGAIQIMQSPDRLLIVSEGGIARTVFLDGRSHANSSPSWVGHSVGRWQGNSLVVETVNFNGDFMILDGPVPASQDARVTETLALAEEGNLLTVKVVYEDPQYLMEPVARMIYMDRQPAEFELLPSSCLENVQGAAEYSAIIGK